MSEPPRLWTSLAPSDRSFVDSEIAVGAKGHRIRYRDGSTRLCATSGLWNVPLGYANPVIDHAVLEATIRSSYLSIFRAPHQLALAAADALVDAAGDPFARVLFSTSGGAANDCAMKLARHFWALRGDDERPVIVGLKGSYHGTMYGSHALSGDDLLQSVYGLDRRSIRHVSAEDGDELATLMGRIGDRVAAVIVEPVLGSGARPLSAEFIETVVQLREKHGFLLVADEVATGFFRTGRMFASESWPAPPDILLVSKALTNGATGGAAVIVSDAVARVFSRASATFVHAETQAGTPPTAAAVLAVLAEIGRTDIQQRTTALGSAIGRLAQTLVDDGSIHTWTGAGCFVGLHLRRADGSHLDGNTVQGIVREIAAEGVVVQPGPSCLQLIPAFDLGRSGLREIEGALRSVLRRTPASSERIS